MAIHMELNRSVYIKGNEYSTFSGYGMADVASAGKKDAVSLIALLLSDRPFL